MNQKGFTTIITLIGLVMVVLVGGAFFLATAPKPSPSVPSLSDSLILYSHLSKSAQDQSMEEFSDPILRVSLSYPKKYFSQSFKADEKNLNAGIFFLKERAAEKEALIRNVIDCILNNRKDPTGICRESNMGDLEVSINKVARVPNYDEDKSSGYAEFQCEREIIDDNRIIYSCLTQLSVDPKDKGMRYSLYLTEGAAKVIKVSTRKPEEFSDLITSVVNSAKILP